MDSHYNTTAMSINPRPIFLSAVTVSKNHFLQLYPVKAIVPIKPVLQERHKCR
jgi:hypothetical protein